MSAASARYRDVMAQQTRRAGWTAVLDHEAGRSVAPRIYPCGARSELEAGRQVKRFRVPTITTLSWVGARVGPTNSSNAQSHHDTYSRNGLLRSIRSTAAPVTAALSICGSSSSCHPRCDGEMAGAGQKLINSISGESASVSSRVLVRRENSDYDLLITNPKGRCPVDADRSFC